mgnify:CR=1 FL=1
MNSTILIGLGGTGSRIVDEVYGRLTEEQKQKTKAHVFDTDINDISERIKNLHPSQITQTGEKGTISSIRKKYSEVDLWLAENVNPNQTITDGAGQNRQASRLGFYCVLKKSAMSTFAKMINDINIVAPNERESTPRVVIVSSLVGGTGSGIYLQVAMYVRKLFRKNSTHVKIRGVFIMPSTFIDYGIVDDTEGKNIRANAYASIKELHGITEFCTQSSNNKTTVELEYDPDNKQSALTVDDRPYDFAFVYEKLDIKNKSLPLFEDVLDQIVRSVYTIMFFPLGSNILSSEDNTYARMGTQRLFASSGVSTLTYPVNEIVDYLALRWQGEVVSKQWRELDDEFILQHNEWKESDLNGVTTKNEPKLSEEYIKYFENKGADHDNRFYYGIYQRQFEKSDGFIDKDKSKYQSYIKLIDEKISKIVDSSHDLTKKVEQASTKLGLEPEEYEDNIQNIEQYIIKKERTLRSINKHIIGLIESGSKDIISQCFECCKEYKNLSQLDLSQFIQNSGDGHAMHPVGLRYFLYKLDNELDLIAQNLINIDGGFIEQEDALHQYEEGPYYNRDERGKKTPISAIDEFNMAKTAKVSIFDKLKGKSPVADSIEGYESKSSRHLTNLKRYHEEKLKYEVYIDFRKKLKGLIKTWETFFKELSVKQNQREMENFLNIHDWQKNESYQYVLSTASHKNKLWDEIQNDISRTPDDEFLKSLIIGQSKVFCGKKDNNSDVLLQWIKQKLKSNVLLSMDILQALEKEADYLQIDHIEHVKYRMQGLKDVSTPRIHMRDGLLSSVDAEGNKLIASWAGMALQNDLPGYAKYKNIMMDITSNISTSGTEKVNTDDLIGGDGQISPYEIHFYQSKYGIAACDLMGFKPGEEYYEDYQGRIESYMKHQLDTTDARFLTPHLDKHWHLLAYFPDLNKDVVLTDHKDIDKAYLLGLAMKLFKPTRYKGDESWVFQDTSQSGKGYLQVSGKPVENSSIAVLFDSLFYNPRVVDSVLATFNKVKNSDFEQYSSRLGDHAFVKNIKDIIDQAIRGLSKSKRGRFTPEDEARLVKRLGELYADYIAEFDQEINWQEKGSTNLKQKIFDKVSNLISTSDFYKMLDEENPQKVVIDGIINSFDYTK